MGLKFDIKPLSFAEEPPQDELDDSLVWDAQKVINVKKQIELGQPIHQSPFFIKDSPDWKRGGITYKWTVEEFAEYVRCMNDVVYFAEEYAYSMTDEGVQNIKLRPYQRIILDRFQKNPYVVFLASRQIGKCVYANTIVNVRVNGKEQRMTTYELYQSQLKKVGVWEYIKGKLYSLLCRLENKLESLER